MLGHSAVAENPIADGALATSWASGFRPVNLGAPGLIPAAATLRPVQLGAPRLIAGYTQASGLLATHLGQPRIIPAAVGIRIPGPGIPALLLTPAGFKPANLGAPTAQSLLRASPFRPVNIGTPTTPVSRSFVASGFLVAHLSAPVSIQFIPKRRPQHCHAPALRPVHLGTPTAS